MKTLEIPKPTYSKIYFMTMMKRVLFRKLSYLDYREIHKNISKN